MDSTRRVTSRDGTQMAFETTGSGPPLVLVDAAGGFRGFGPMGELAEAMAPHFTVVRYDRRGRGASTDPSPYAVEREVEDLAALIEAAGAPANVHGFSSGAVLALHGAASGLPIRRLSLLEPVLDPDQPPGPDPLETELAELIAAGRRGDAIEHFNRAIGVPEEYLAGMRDAAWWPAMESLAHTLVYDCVIGRTPPATPLPSITTPTLVIASESTDDRLLGWATNLAAQLPNGSFTALPGEWHGVPTDVLAPALLTFFEATDA